MNRRVILNDDYKKWISQLSIRYRNAQIKAAVAVNTEMLRFYWGLGRDINAIQSKNKYGSEFFETISRDLKTSIPEAKGLSASNLKYFKRFYLMYNSNRPQVVDDLERDTSQQPSDCFTQLESTLFQIPWGHHRLLIDKYFNEPETALFYIKENEYLQ